MRILILDTPAGDLRPLRMAFEHLAVDGDSVRSVSTAEALVERLAAGPRWDVVVIDHLLGDGNEPGLPILRRVRALDRELPIVAALSSDAEELVRAVVEAGATDFLVRAERLRERIVTLMAKLRQILEIVAHNRRLSVRLREAEGGRWTIVGQSPQMMALIDTLDRLARVPRPVLIVGERGTGKELVARALHDAGGQPGGDATRRPFVAVNCAAFTPSLLERELFGHEKGAFTGADARMSGKFEQAHAGTLFLDEIGNMSLPFQRKILRVVEYGSFTRVGGSKEVSVVARVIAATNSNLEERMRQGLFLRDLYDRLAFEVIRVPPLREREGDVEVLARHFLERFMSEVPAFQGKHLSRRALDVLRRYHFPGNVRELKNVIERAVYRDTTTEIGPEDIGMLRSQASDIPGSTFKEKLDAFERQLVLEALETASGNQAQAARLLGVTYHQYRYYLKKHEEGASGEAGPDEEEADSAPGEG